jgi:hypothetical protein
MTTKKVKDIIEVVSKPSECPACLGKGYTFDRKIGISRFCLKCLQARGEEQHNG